MWIPDRGREGRGQVPATSPAHGAQRSRKGRRRRLGRILPNWLYRYYPLLWQKTAISYRLRFLRISAYALFSIGEKHT